LEIIAKKGGRSMNEPIVVIVRSIIAFFTLLIFTRVLGKQQISQLTFFDYILGITIGSVAASLTTDLDSRAWPHWVGLFMWTLLVWLIQWITTKSRKLSIYLDGEPTIVIMNGKIMEDAMKKLRYRIDDLVEQLRQKDVYDITQVEFAIIEKDGRLSVLKKAEHQSVTRKDMNVAVQPESVATEIIYDGVVIYSNLRQLKLDTKWLYGELKKMNIDSPGEVMYMSRKQDGTLYVDLYKDHINRDNVTDTTD
jgi:uncharacterized membrane protein YcaP (DUF421 family)